MTLAPHQVTELLQEWSEGGGQNISLLTERDGFLLSGVL